MVPTPSATTGCAEAESSVPTTVAKLGDAVLTAPQEPSTSPKSNSIVKTTNDSTCSVGQQKSAKTVAKHSGADGVTFFTQTTMRSLSILKTQLTSSSEPTAAHTKLSTKAATGI